MDDDTRSDDRCDRCAGAQRDASQPRDAPLTTTSDHTADLDRDGRVDATAMSELLVESFAPVAPDPETWDRIAAATTTHPGRTAQAATGPRAPSRTGDRWRPYLAVAAAVVVLAASLGFIVAQRGTDLPVEAATVSRTLVDPASGMPAMIVVSDVTGASSVVDTELGEIDGDTTYQLWAVVGDEIVSVGLLGSDVRNATFRLEGSPSVLALTIESSGGVAVSTQTPVAVWQPSG